MIIFFSLPRTLTLSCLGLIVPLVLFTGCATSKAPSIPPDPVQPQIFPDALTLNYDNARTGVQAHETILNTSNVNATAFGKLFSLPVDGLLYAHPLVVTGYTMADNKLHNVLFAVTAHGTVYAFDADNQNPAAGYLWKLSLIPDGEESVTTADYHCPAPSPEAVAIGTPVIDRAAGALYVVGRTKSNTAGMPKYIQRIHALNLADGTEKYGGPTAIQASIPGSGDGSTTVTFDPLIHNQRAALLLSQGSVYIAWASHCDLGPYHGWVIGYNARDVSQQTAVFNDSPNGALGGIWMGAGGITADAEGNLFLVSGNGTFDADMDGDDFSDSILKLSQTPLGLVVADYFTPSHVQTLNDMDLDVGTTEAMLYPSVAGGTPDRLLSTDKTGRVYILDADHLGKYQTGAEGVDSKNGDLQDFAMGNLIFRQPAYFNGKVYIGAQGLPLKAFSVQSGVGNVGGTLDINPASVTPNTFSNAIVIGGTSPVISANGTTGGVVWAIDNTGGATTLHAYDAANLATELYNSDQAAGGRDQSEQLQVEFQSPVVADGHVFLAGETRIDVYGLLSKQPLLR